MKISLIGYMGSGKSTIGRSLAKKLRLNFIDLDQKIEETENKKISEIFNEKGEIYFRKIENQILKELLLSNESFVLALGGGTPVFYNSMELVNQFSESFYLRLTPNELKNRLSKEKGKRPLIAHLNDDDLEEFIAKHLFERNPFYSEAKHQLAIKEKSIDEVVTSIFQILNQR
jgi:shikimate kinase